MEAQQLNGRLGVLGSDQTRRVFSSQELLPIRPMREAHVLWLGHQEEMDIFFHTLAGREIEDPDSLLSEGGRALVEPARN